MVGRVGDPMVPRKTGDVTGVRPLGSREHHVFVGIWYVYSPVPT